MMKKYNKLVRDKIPEIITSNGKRCIYRSVSGEEYLNYLHLKLTEEILEFYLEPSALEAADILEVLEELYKAYGISREEVSRAKLDKVLDKGSFCGRVVLQGVEE
jgi:predicted house-cleaning noncanonical NTP pyrophosphatase (MazG superfamily)